MSISEAVTASALKHGERAALLSWSGESWHELTFRDLVRRVDGLARFLVSDGLGSGDRVAILGHNSPEWGQAYLAIQRAGGVAVPLDRLQSVAEWLDVIERAGVGRLFVAHGEGVRLLPDLSEKAPHIKSYALQGGFEGTVATLGELSDRAGSEHLPEISSDQVASILFTSGTTGRSKGVMLSHANILANAQGMISRVRIDPQRDRFLSVLPMSHCYECTCGFIAPLLAGAPVYYARGFAPREIVADLERSGATFLLGVPLLYEKIASGIDRALRDAGLRGQVARTLWSVSHRGRPLWKHNFGRLVLRGVRTKTGLRKMRYLVSGGAPLPPSVAERLEALGVRVLQGYGLTETSPVITLTPPRGAHPASVGLPLPGIDVKIYEPSGAGDGEVLVRGATVMRGYWDDEDATRRAHRDGWFCTGDLGRFDERGYLYITGRLKNLIISPGGKNISPEEIESAACRCPAVAEIMVYGRPTASGSGEVVCARVFPDLEYAQSHGVSPSDARSLLDLVRAQVVAATSRLAPYKKVVHYELVLTPFEKTTSHKIMRFKHGTPTEIGP